VGFRTSPSVLTTLRSGSFRYTQVRKLSTDGICPSRNTPLSGGVRSHCSDPDDVGAVLPGLIDKVGAFLHRLHPAICLAECRDGAWSRGGCRRSRWIEPHLPGQTGHPYARDTALSHPLSSALFCCGEDLRLGARERHAPALSRNLTTLWLCSPQGCSMNLAHCCIRCRRSAKASRRR